MPTITIVAITLSCLLYKSYCPFLLHRVVHIWLLTSLVVIPLFLLLWTTSCIYGLHYQHIDLESVLDMVRLIRNIYNTQTPPTE